MVVNIGIDDYVSDRDKIKVKGNTYYWMDRKLGIRSGDRFITHRKPQHYFRKGQGFCVNKHLAKRLKRSSKIKWFVVIYHGKRGEKVYKKKTDNIDLSQTVKEAEFETQVLIKETEFDVVRGR